ncbi:protein commissureless 2 homolog [Aedes albopictus]|uniref:Protein commissureless 2 homolog n=1 Tax=Aedes albopictus TaxID=7160 RepID=A0ABM1ZII3_AEDAL|nr:protein commissureless 2 homolog [Aedes albopictus]
MIDSLDSKIEFAIPNPLDIAKLIRGKNYSSFWSDLHQQETARAVAMGSLGLGVSEPLLTSEYNASDFNLLSSLQSFAGRPGAVGFTADGSEQLLDPTYERFIGDVWVGIVLTLMILSSIFCMCSCFLYHKFRQWQRSVLNARSQTLSSMDLETPPPYDVESLPSYTIVSGLPSYNDAIEQLKQKQQQKSTGGHLEPVKVQRPSVIKLFESQSQDLLAGAKLEEIRYNFASNLTTSVVSENSPEVTPTTSSGSSTAVNATTVAVVPNFKTQVSASEPKKFTVCSYSVENERSGS